MQRAPLDLAALQVDAAGLAAVLSDLGVAAPAAEDLRALVAECAGGAEAVRFEQFLRILDALGDDDADLKDMPLARTAVDAQLRESLPGDARRHVAFSTAELFQGGSEAPVEVRARAAFDRYGRGGTIDAG